MKRGTTPKHTQPRIESSRLGTQLLEHQPLTDPAVRNYRNRLFTITPLQVQFSIVLEDIRLNFVSTNLKLFGWLMFPRLFT